MTRVALVALAMGFVGCGGDDGGGEAAAPTPGTFVGDVQGSDTDIALVTDGQKVAGYLCDDTNFSAWLVESEIADTARRHSRIGADGASARSASATARRPAS
ncbi:MAG: hypothetical protein ACRDLS_05720 [Solirubrobacteraceae bacterium]